MRVLAKFSRIVDGISEALGRLSVYLVIAAVAIGFFNVVARYLGRFIGMQLSSNLFIELQWHLYALVFFFGFAYILRHNINVRVDFIYGAWPPKRKALIDLWGHLLFLVPFCILGIIVTINPVLTSWGRLPGGSWGTWELSPDPNGLPRAPIKTMIIVAFVLLLLQTIAELIKLTAVFTGHSDLVNLPEDMLETETPRRIE